MDPKVKKIGLVNSKIGRHVKMNQRKYLEFGPVNDYQKQT